MAIFGQTHATLSDDELISLWSQALFLLRLHDTVRTSSHVVAIGVSYGVATGRPNLAAAAFCLWAVLSAWGQKLNNEYMELVLDMPPIPVPQDPAFLDRLHRGRRSMLWLAEQCLKLSLVFLIAVPVCLLLGWHVLAAWVYGGWNLCSFLFHRLTVETTRSRSKLWALKHLLGSDSPYRTAD